MFRIKYRLHRIYNIFNLSKEYGIRVFYDTSYREEARKERRKKNKNLRNKKLYGLGWGKQKKNRKKRLYKRNKKCFWCEQYMKFNEATIDHIVPVSIGYRNHSISNLRLIHNDCRVARDRAIEKGELK